MKLGFKPRHCVCRASLTLRPRCHDLMWAKCLRQMPAPAGSRGVPATVFISRGCCNKGLQTELLKSIEIYSHTSREPKSEITVAGLKCRCSQAPGKSQFTLLPVSGTLACGHLVPISALIIILSPLSPCRISLCMSFRWIPVVLYF